MRPRVAADYRTLLWVFVLTPALVAAQCIRPALAPYLCLPSCYFALACGVIAHNHNHCPTMTTKWANRWFGNWISIFYGYPTFAWIPTHNLNHHRYVNRPGDATITWRYTNAHAPLVAATYFFVSSYFQAGPIKTYLRKARERNRPLCRRVILQYLVVYGTHAALLGVLVWAHGWSTGIVTWLLACGIPGFFALWTIMLFNYEQHAHADPWSEHDHSRNFVSPVLNFLLFNNGYHTVHHEHASAHWSTAPELHRRIAPAIDRRLIEKSVWAYWFRIYVLGTVFPRYRTRQVGRAGFETPDGRASSVATADVGIGEAGTNAAMS